MGTYCQLYIGDYPVFSWKSQAFPLAMTLFRETDKRVFERPETGRNMIEWGHAKWNPKNYETVVEYRTTVAAAKDRLRVMGFTMEMVAAEFAEVSAGRLEELGRWSSDGDEELYQDEIDLLSKSGLQEFLDAFRYILNCGVHPIHVAERIGDAPELVLYMLDSRSEDLFWKFPCYDFRVFVRAMLEVLSDDAPVFQDITDLVDGGYYDEGTPVVELALLELKGTYDINSPVIVLTEGTTDNECISAALKLLYPHLEGYFSFMDLAARTPGGAGSLTHVVRSFAGAGIENRVVALFDNDAAGTVSAEVLKKGMLPTSIKVLQLPDIDIARNYPTVGPSGFMNHDVNGAACSIEMYFGRDILASSGALTPVVWKGREERIKRYQGEVQGKDALKSAFLRKVEMARSNPALIQSQDWTEIRALLDQLINAFNSASPIVRRQVREDE